MSAEQKVTKGLQTWMGYGAAGAAAATPLIAWALTLPLPESAIAVLLAIAGILAAVTGKNRSDQAAALILAAKDAPPIIDAGDAGAVGPDGEPILGDAEGDLQVWVR